MFKSWPTIRQETKQESKIKPRTKFSRRLPSTATRRTALRPARPVLHKHFAHSQQKKRKRRKRRREAPSEQGSDDTTLRKQSPKPNLRSRKLLHVSTAGFLLNLDIFNSSKASSTFGPGSNYPHGNLRHIARQYILFLRQT